MSFVQWFKDEIWREIKMRRQCISRRKPISFAFNCHLNNNNNNISNWKDSQKEGFHVYTAKGRPINLDRNTLKRTWWWLWRWKSRHKTDYNKLVALLRLLLYGNEVIAERKTKPKMKRNAFICDRRANKDRRVISKHVKSRKAKRCGIGV